MRIGERIRRGAAACAVAGTGRIVGMSVVVGTAVLLGTVVVAEWSSRPALSHEDPSKIVDQVAEQIRRGFFGGPAEPWLESDELLAYARANPAPLRKVCAAADEGRRGLVGGDEAKSQALTARLVEIATACLEQNPKDADAHWSLALARLIRGRTARDRGGKPDPADWSEAAGLLEKAGELRPEGGAPAAEAAQALLEAAKLPGADGPALVKRADDLLDRATAQHPAAGGLLRVWAVRVAERAAAIPPSKKADVVALVDGALKRLAPEAQKKGPDLDVATAWNSLVAFLLDRKLPTKHEFVTETNRVGVLEMKVPLSRQFRVDEDDGSVHQLSATFEPVRTFTFGTYNWDTAYDFGLRDSPGGDNAKGIATADFNASRPEYLDATGVKEVAKGRVNGRIGGAYVWEVTGRRKDAKKPERMRCFYFKSEKGNQVTFALRIHEWDLSEMDAAGKSVLDSLTELGK